MGRLATLVLITMLIGCGTPAPDDEVVAAPESAPPPHSEPGVIDIRAEDFSFTAPPTFPSGWVTLRFENQGEESHFVSIIELPEGVTFDSYTSGVSDPFNILYAEYRAGELDQAGFFEKLGAEVPEWIFTARRAGGPGFTAPGVTSETTIQLDPGSYIMECYVRTKAEGHTFHGAKGMLRPLIVTDEDSGRMAPDADIEITLSNYALTVDGDLSAGRHMARVSVADNPDSLTFHNVHLVRLEGETEVAAVATWLDWVDNMLPPAPARLLGGAGQASAGSVSYLTVDLEPGRYAFVSELHGLQGMTHEFTVQ